LETPEPMGKLDTVTVNGPEDEIIDWDALDWRRVEDAVRRLRQRIFTATQEGDLIRVRNLQKLMLGSRANALLSVRRVTELNAGRKTAGVDGRVVLAEWEKAEMAACPDHMSFSSAGRVLGGQARLHPHYLHSERIIPHQGHIGANTWPGQRAPRVGDACPLHGIIRPG
jgi:N-terminal domain of reverse transcriptase